MMSLRSLAFGMLLIIAAATAYFLFKSYTPPIFSSDAVAELTAVEINGDRQFLLIRGKDSKAPVVLFLHGGPGMPAMYLAHAFQRSWEDDFVIVHWDQRASGKSFKEGSDADLMRTSQLIDDAEEVVEYLRGRFPDQRLYLFGHSHGSYLGAILASRHPDWLSAYIGVGQVADEAEAMKLQDAFLKPRLSEFGYDPETVLDEALREELLFKTRSEIYGETSFIPLLLTGLLAPEYSLFDALNVGKGSSFSSAHMKRDVISGSPMTDLRDFDTPVYFIMGAQDMVTPTSLARTYFDQIEAPAKEFHIVERSAHFPFFEQPEAVLSILKRIAAADNVVSEP